MQAGLIILCLGYVLSQFFRAFLAVLSSALQTDLGASPEDLAFASGLWFLTFAVMQLPVGWALDRIGPSRTAAALLLFGGGGGALVFALASQPVHISFAMVLIGVGCSPVLMASYYIFAREYPPRRFATLAALMLGVGSLGNLVASYPTALAVEVLGWRGTLFGLAGISTAVALGIAVTVKDPARVEASDGPKGSVLDILRMPVLWPIFIMMFVAYAPSAALRGLWIGPYMSDVFGLGSEAIGVASLVMGGAMILGTFAYGPMDRLLGTRKGVVLGGNLLACAALGGLMLYIDGPVPLVVALMAAVGFFGAAFPVILAQGRAFVPPHLVGRGVTMLNFFGIGGVGIMQFASGRLHAETTGAELSLPYFVIFGFLLAFLAAGCAIYLLSRDSLD
ncbi:transporter, MFS family [Phaeobacter inhibens]|uniref:Transporter, MFS family n=1 Tax=Phaeobacter inhibens TaxID=221822 RepID=A0A2I7K0A1_9RHOB|nr:MFS transporter [Phaeobacter inhibens]AUQ51445.1 transporter, MFS family [Phaeobacter inhibens]AUQ69046.1 transporter, MFS family [Phaeobacter inhibens]AUQ96027.1 transporter, MFS family [Phaeobacter inhibens]AUQ97536.1 transporter, MFS family [Phaeobacter inhibens]AUR21250.1 transporter, MFS family [Phaeobacter inhibens]